MRNLALHAPGGEAPQARAREFATLAEALRWTLRDEAKKSRTAEKALTKGSATRTHPTTGEGCK
jgi:hypothetical protein